MQVVALALGAGGRGGDRQPVLHRPRMIRCHLNRTDFYRVDGRNPGGLSYVRATRATSGSRVRLTLASRSK